VAIGRHGQGDVMNYKAYAALVDGEGSSGLLDDFIRECEHRGRDVEAKNLGSRERR
jgi:hypothetical protein